MKSRFGTKTTKASRPCSLLSSDVCYLLFILLTMPVACTKPNKTSPVSDDSRSLTSHALAMQDASIAKHPAVVSNSLSASLGEIQKITEALSQEQLEALSNSLRLSGLSDAELLIEVMKDPELWRKLPTEQAQLDWAIKVFYKTFPDGAPFAVSALLSLTNSSKAFIAAQAAFVLSVCQIRSSNYSSARDTLSTALERHIGPLSIEEAALNLNAEQKHAVDRLLKARAVLARHAGWTEASDSVVYWYATRIKLYTDFNGQCSLWDLYEHQANALMRMGQREEAIKTLEKALQLRGTLNTGHSDYHAERLRAWKNGSVVTDVYDL